ncbi:hypothetical protein GCM10011571_17560 [Marinithermofilum abyssi]|uniref:Uncharacterized protein n=1 Tax=Marinithermofilum abyssi TaxID=1571185 RepID=A0A8J2YDD3_9BACL|nr:hypothetical protein [Marinithermofilum abyssi]GGE16364.1 hypothetical protein GCM10011571_17560 [Marinithermofilum abyssi]
MGGSFLKSSSIRRDTIIDKNIAGSWEWDEQLEKWISQLVWLSTKHVEVIVHNEVTPQRLEDIERQLKLLSKREQELKKGSCSTSSSTT